MKGLGVAFRRWCEDEGIRWRHTLGFYAYDPLPAKRLAQHLGIRIVSPTELPDLDEQTLQVLLAKDAGWSALAVPLPIAENKHWIIYNPTHAATRYESDVMHELSHLILGHEPIRFSLLADSVPVREYRPEDEECAKYLGGCLQITIRGLDWAFQRNMTHLEIAQHFGASVQMVRYRCNMTRHS
jgi:hypothetical protein